MLKIWNEVWIDQNNSLVRKDMDPYRLDSLKVLKTNNIASGAPNTGSVALQITDLITQPNGAIITCGLDKSISLWEEKKGNANCACCIIF